MKLVYQYITFPPLQIIFIHKSRIAAAIRGL